MKSFNLFTLLIYFIGSGIEFSFAQPVEPAMGKQGLKEFIEGQMIYPQQAINADIKARVKLLCRIGSDGRLIETQTLEEYNNDLIRESKRLARGIVWKPAQEKSKAIDGEYVLEIEFNPKKYSKWVKRRGWDRPNPEWDTSMQIFSHGSLSQLAKPELPQGVSFSDFIRQNIQSPDAARRMGISGRVVLSFIVEPDGSSSNFIIKEYLGMGCTEEAIRVMKLLRWQAARKNEKMVRSWNTTMLWFGEGQPQYNLQPGYNPGSML